MPDSKLTHWSRKRHMVSHDLTIGCSANCIEPDGTTLLPVQILAHQQRGPAAIKWWRHQMETFSALLVIWAGNSPVPSEFPAQRPMTQSFDVFFDLRLNKRLSKQWWGWWFETLSRPLWRNCNEHGNNFTDKTQVIDNQNLFLNYTF